MTVARSLAYFVATLVVLSGCAAIQRQQAADAKGLLTQAGFRVGLADEAGLPARQLVAQSAAGTTVYKYSDPENCNCLYVGGPAEYAELERLRLERVREHEELLRAWSPYAPAALWGPWNPEGLNLK